MPDILMPYAVYKFTKNEKTQHSQEAEDQP